MPAMVDETRRELLEGGTLIWQGRPNWRAWTRWTILGRITLLSDLDSPRALGSNRLRLGGGDRVAGPTLDPTP